MVYVGNNGYVSDSCHIKYFLGGKSTKKFLVFSD
jgi:hypothetical protein